MKEIIPIVLVIIGALIGAGFASGQEIYSFFYAYGIYGIYGIIIMCILLGILIYKSLEIIYKRKINNYDDFLGIFIRNLKVRKAVNIVVNILLLISFFIMVAGFGAYFKQEIGISKIIGSIILILLCIFVFSSNIKGVLKVSNIVVPILIIFITFLGFKNIMTISNVRTEIIKKRWLLSSLIYTSYNLILLIPVLISLRKQITKEKNIKLISVITTMTMLILSFMIFFLLGKAESSEIEFQEMPIVYIISKYFFEYRKIYAFIILVSIFTTAISVGIGFIQNISNNSKNYPQVVAFMCISSLIISNFGFSKLINFAYPFFGYAGLIQIFMILILNI